MILRINGKEEPVEGPLSLAALVKARQLCPEKIVVEHNLRIVSRGDWPQVTLGDKDTIEIVSFVGGGGPWKTC